MTLNRPKLWLGFTNIKNCFQYFKTKKKSSLTKLVIKKIATKPHSKSKKKCPENLKK